MIAKSFERIHRNNLAGLGVLPLQFRAGDDARSLNLDGSETFDLLDIEQGIQQGQEVTLRITRRDGSQQTVSLLARIDTAIEAVYFQNGGILPYVLDSLTGLASTNLYKSSAIQPPQ